jgi:hypothetical protein
MHNTGKEYAYYVKYAPVHIYGNDLLYAYLKLRYAVLYVKV